MRTLEKPFEKVIEIKNVRKVYHMGREKIYAVDDVNFEILKGEFCCLLGTSGSGKSTLLNLMAGIEKASGGDIVIKGNSIRKMSENGLAKFRQNYLGFVFQSYNLMGSMNALENVEFPLVFKRVRPKKRREMAARMLRQVGLGSRLNHKPKEMSGGQQQRVGIARAFVANPEIVFADEPTGNLDTKTAMEVMELMHGLARRNRQTIVMVTHDPRLAEYADKIIHILDGKIQSVEVKKSMEEINAESEQAIREYAEEQKRKKEEKKRKRQELKEAAKRGRKNAGGDVVGGENIGEKSASGENVGEKNTSMEKGGENAGGQNASVENVGGRIVGEKNAGGEKEITVEPDAGENENRKGEEINEKE